jgi:sterol desaturase/sphingolipid hydroxylase (fatty acid hydroxylase superfamily)
VRRHFLDRVLISPTLHQVHHSYAPEHLDKNYGGMLAIWDLLAGTLYVPGNNETLTFGLPTESIRIMILSSISICCHS